MDPFSIAVGVVGLVSLATQTLNITTKYINGVRHSATAASALAKELEVLRSVLLRLDAFLNEKSSKWHLSIITDDSVLVQSTHACQSQLESLYEKLHQAKDKRFKTALAWPLKEDEHRQSIQELRTVAQWIQIALTIDGCAMLWKTSAEVMEVLEGQLKCFQELQEINVRTASVERSLEAHTQMLAIDRKAQERNKILEWISTQDYNSKHSAIRVSRVNGTGQWLLDHPTFQVWRDDTESNNLLWCHGIPGSGKTVLSSLVIDHLQEGFRSHDLAMAFTYFDYRDQEHQSPGSIVASLLKHIALEYVDLPEPILDLDRKFKDKNSRAQLKDLENAFSLMCQKLKRVFIVIDALDECDEREHRQTFMQVLHRLREKQNVRLFITSRPHPQDIKKAFSSASQITIEAHDSDLRKYLSNKIENSDAVDLIDEHFKIGIIKKIADRANKMFLLPALQIQTVLSEPTIGEMEDALGSMPLTLHEAFDETMARIHRQPEGRRRLARRILMWLSHAMSPLTVIELSETLATRVGQTSLDRRYLPSQRSMVECCLGLAIVDEESSSIRLAHYSIHEYLNDRQPEIFPSAEDDIAEQCFTYLSLDSLSQGCCDTEKHIYARIRNHPFLRYASSHWGHHVRKCRNGKVIKLAVSFLDSRLHRAMSTQINEYLRGRREDYWIPDEVNSLTSLHVASSFGLRSAARDILASGDIDIDAETNMGTTPLIKAASAGHVEVVRLLLSKNADPRKTNWYGTALHCAAEAGQWESIRVLLDAGMAVDYRDPFGRTSLHCAVDMGHTPAAALLLENDADPNAQADNGKTPVHFALLHNCPDQLLQLLLAHGGDTSIKAGGMTMVHYTAIAGFSKKVSLLLANGANIESKDGKGFTPLHCAVASNKERTVSTLLRLGASVKTRNFVGSTPLATATTYKFTPIEKLLVEYGAKS